MALQVALVSAIRARARFAAACQMGVVLAGYLCCAWMPALPAATAASAAVVVLALPLLSMPWLLGQEQSAARPASSGEGTVQGAGGSPNMAFVVPALILAAAAAVLEVAALHSPCSLLTFLRMHGAALPLTLAVHVPRRRLKITPTMWCCMLSGGY
jgi:hypothetical protein